nr:MAG: RNA-dependent RNA polymerase [Totiviridae sp.]
MPLRPLRRGTCAPVDSKRAQGRTEPWRRWSPQASVRQFSCVQQQGRRPPRAVRPPTVNLPFQRGPIRALREAMAWRGTPPLGQWVGPRPRQKLGRFAGADTEGKLTLDWGWVPLLRWDSAGTAVRRAFSGVCVAANYAGLESLRRSRYTSPVHSKTIGTWAGSFCGPLSLLADFADRIAHDNPLGSRFYASLLLKIGERVREVASLSSVTGVNLERLSRDFEGHRDDVVRTVIADIEKEVSACGTDARLAVSGLHTSGGPRGWEREQVVEHVREWVQGDAPLFEGEETWVRGTLSRWFRSWVTSSYPAGMAKPNLFQYRLDPVRWGTSGGASPTSESLAALKKLFPGMEKMAFRTKTIAGVSALMFGKMDDLLRPSNICHAALKEEAKTRVIISTPMHSYVDTCFLLDLLGPPTFLKSTISGPSYLASFTDLYARYYSAIDASRFDFNVPKWLLRAIWEELAAALDPVGHVNYTQAAEICRSLSSELDRLVVEVLGVHVKYEKGLLSGWRSTSFVGSLISALCCEHYVQSLPGSIFAKPNLSVGYIVQGDDIILFSSTHDLADSVDHMRGLGVATHPSKCLIGQEGDFLRAIYTRDGRKTYPMRSLRSLFYANPWIEQRAFKGLVEISQNWLIAESRFSLLSPSRVPETFIRRVACADIARWSGGSLSATQVRCLYETPLAVGGLGPIESVLGGVATVVDIDYARTGEVSRTQFPSLWNFVGVSVPLKPVKKFHLRHVDIPLLRRVAREAFSGVSESLPDWRDLNLTSLLLSVVRDTEGRRRGKDLCGPEFVGLERALALVGYVDYRKYVGGLYRCTTRTAELLSFLFSSCDPALSPSIYQLSAPVAAMLEDVAVHLGRWLKLKARAVSSVRAWAAGYTLHVLAQSCSTVLGTL